MQPVGSPPVKNTPQPVPLILGNSNVALIEDYVTDEPLLNHITFLEPSEPAPPAYVSATFQSAVTMLRVVSQVGGDLWKQQASTPNQLSSSPISIKSSNEHSEKIPPGTSDSPVLIAPNTPPSTSPSATPAAPPPVAPPTPSVHPSVIVRKQCMALIGDIMKHKNAWPFNFPVDPVALGIPDFYDVIKHPMDFGTIKSKLESEKYDSFEQFEQDIQLVFANAIAYGKEGSDIAVMAECLKQFFEILSPATRERLAAELRGSSVPSAPSSPSVAAAAAAAAAVSSKPTTPLSTSPLAGTSPQSRSTPSAPIAASPQPVPKSAPGAAAPKAPVSKSLSGTIAGAPVLSSAKQPAPTAVLTSSSGAIVSKQQPAAPSVSTAKQPTYTAALKQPLGTTPPAAASASPKQQTATTLPAPSAAPVMSSSIEMRPQLNSVQMRFLRDTASCLTRDYIRPLLRACIHDERLSNLFATSLQIGLGHFLPWWITSASRVAELKLRVIDALLDGLASFLDDYNSIISAKSGKQLDDENAILVQFAALFHSRKQQYAFQPTVDAAGEAEIKRRCSVLLLEQVWPLIAELPAVLQLHREFEEDYKELVLQQLSLVEEVLGALLDPMLLFEFVGVMANRLDAVAKQPITEAPKPLSGPSAKQPPLTTAVDFRTSIRKLQNSLVAIARLPFLLSNPIELLLSVLVESKLQAAIHDSIATSETPKAKLELLKTVRELLWNTVDSPSPSASPQPAPLKADPSAAVTVNLVPIVDTSTFKQGQVKDRESLEKLINQMLDSLLLIIRSRSFFPGAGAIAKDPLRNLLTCIVNITQQPKVTKTLIFHYLLPRIFALLQ